MINYFKKFINYFKFNRDKKELFEDQIPEEEVDPNLVRKSCWGKTLTDKEYTYTVADDGSWVTFSKGSRPAQRINADYSIWIRVVGNINRLD